MRHLGKLTAVVIAALALIAPATAQADPGTNANLSTGWVEFVGKTTCSWANVPTSGINPVTIRKDDINAAISCTNGYWGVVNADLVISFNNPSATIALVDVTGGAFFFWCRYVKSNAGLTGGPPTYTGSFQVPLDSTNTPGACSDPANINASLTFH